MPVVPIYLNIDDKTYQGIKAGTLKLVGTDEEVIYKNFNQLLSDNEEYEKMSHASNPYGDGTACEKIVKILIK